MVKRILNDYFKQRREGSLTFEVAISAPFVILLIGLCLFFSLLFISWTSFGALSSELAKDLNLRSNGLQEANAHVPSGNVLIRGTSGNKDLVIYKSQFTVNDKQSGNQLLNSYKNALMYKAVGYKNQFFLPYCEFKKCNVDILQLGANGSYNTDISTTATLSNYIVRVTIDYNFLPIKLMGFQLPDITVHTNGYSVVT